MQKEMIIEKLNTVNEELKARGIGTDVIDLSHATVMKNNRDVESIVIKSGNTNSAISYYPTELDMELTTDEFIDRIFRIKEKNEKDIDTSWATDLDYVKSHVYPRIYAISNEERLKENGIAYTNYLDFLICLYIDVSEALGDHATCNVKKQMIEVLDTSLEDLMSYAFKNAFMHLKIATIGEVFKEMGFPFDVPGTEVPMYVMSNEDKCLGAGSILSVGACNEMAYKMGVTRFIVLPSSIHEVLCVPEDIADYDELLNTVIDVNRTQVSDEERLTNSIYLYNAETEELSLLQTA